MGGVPARSVAPKDEDGRTLVINEGIVQLTNAS